MQKAMSLLTLILVLLSPTTAFPGTAQAAEHGGAEHGGTAMEGSHMEGDHMHGTDAETLLEAADVLMDSHPDLAARLEKIAKHLS